MEEIEIKFRAWEKVKVDDTGTYGGEMYYSEECDEKRAVGFVVKTDSGYSNDDFIWMQYIGVKDKNDTEAYVGDAYKYYQPLVQNSRQIYKERIIIIKPTIESWHQALCLSQATRGIEIIGNIYENPEILEKERKG